MKYPSWEDFKSKYSCDQRGAFEALARMLFRAKYGLGDSLPYFKNHPGNETETITDNGDVIGFQGKFFDDEINSTDIKDSIEKAKKYNPNQNKIVVYTNAEFTALMRNGVATCAKRDNIEKFASEKGLTIEWICGNDVLDAVAKSELAYNVFFCPNSNLMHLQHDVYEQNDILFQSINNYIQGAGSKYRINRDAELAALSGNIENHANVIVFGESGSGKSAVVKDYYEQNKDKEDYAIYIINGAQLETDKVQNLFSLGHEYNLAEFCDYYNDFEKKVFIIDSAERILDLQNKHVALVLINKLQTEGWSIVLTCKENAITDLTSSLSKDFSLQFETIKVNNISQETFENIVKELHLSLPDNKKLLEHLHIPFYLARYAELDTHSNSIADFRETVWNQKVRNNRKNGKQNEDCLLEIVRRIQKGKGYVVSCSDLNYESLTHLADQDIICEYPHQGYYIKHDIYQDWALDYLIQKDFKTKEDIAEQLSRKPSVSYVNAFSRWFDSAIQDNQSLADDIINQILSTKTDDRWVNAIFKSIGKDDSYARVFFEKNNDKLSENNYIWFNTFAHTLCTSCIEVSRYVTFETQKIPIFNTVGLGWDEAVSFINKNKEDYFKNNLNTIYSVLDGYQRKSQKSKDTEKIAGLLSLHIFNIVAEARKKDEFFWFKDSNRWCGLICRYAITIAQELNKIILEVVSAGKKCNNPYSELMDYVITTDNTFEILPVAIACRKSYLALLGMYWHLDKETRHGFGDLDSGSNAFGVDPTYSGGGSGYFPPSAMQTPIYTLLEAENMMDISDNATLDFIINFTNTAVDKYSESGYAGDVVYKIPVELDGTTKQIKASNALWNLYRGTSGLAMPDLLECIHMALEKFLLEHSENKGEENKVRDILWHILRTSYSASFYAVVASVATAFYDKYFDVLMFLEQDIRFLDLDLHRRIAEIHATSTFFMYHRHRALGEERKKSAERKHRQMDLEMILPRLQLIYMEGKDEKEKSRYDSINNAIDKLKAQVDSMSEDISDLQFIVNRIDTRDMQKHIVKLQNGVEAVQYDPVLPEHLEKSRKETEEFSNKMLAGTFLRTWCQKKYEGDIEGAKIYQYNDNVSLVSQQIKIIEDKLKAKDASLYDTMADEFVPYMASAILLLYYSDRLDDNTKNECQDRLIAALKDPAFLLSSPMSGFDVCLGAVPVLIEQRKDRHDTLRDILLIYAKRRREIGNYRSCDIVCNMIQTSKLWEKQPEFMESVVVACESSFAAGAYLDTITPEEAETLLCLLTPLTSDRKRGNMCVLRLSDMWIPKERFDESHYYDKLSDGDMVASYIMNSPLQELGTLITPFAENLTGSRENEFFLDKFLLICVNNNKYESFWKVWQTITPIFTKHKFSGMDGGTIRTFMLNPDGVTVNGDEWFRFQEKDNEFFKSVTDEVSNNEDVLYSTLKAYTAFAKKYVLAGVPMVHKMTRNIALDNQRDMRKVILFYLDKFADIVNLSEGLEHNTDVREQYVDILEYMRKLGSTRATVILNQL